MRLRCDPTEKALSCIRAANSAGVLVAIQGKGVAAYIFAPEGALESRLQCVGFAPKSIPLLWSSDCPRECRRLALRRIDISLHLAQGDRTMRERAVCVRDAVLG